MVDTLGGVNEGGKVEMECKRHSLRYQITIINVTLSCCVKDATGTPRDVRVKRKVCVSLHDPGHAGSFIRKGGVPQVRSDTAWYSGVRQSRTRMCHNTYVSHWLVGPIRSTRGGCPSRAATAVMTYVNATVDNEPRILVRET